MKKSKLQTDTLGRESHLLLLKWWIIRTHLSGSWDTTSRWNGTKPQGSGCSDDSLLDADSIACSGTEYSLRIHYRSNDRPPVLREFWSSTKKGSWVPDYRIRHRWQLKAPLPRYVCSSKESQKESGGVLYAGIWFRNQNPCVGYTEYHMKESFHKLTKWGNPQISEWITNLPPSL